ncbi:hypothetical protein G6N74_09970, partial [Mesorhizobium sp. CGMCC 1.15528]|nr:hypothetical protein [Mesorhizobium zhangyense]
GEAYRRTLLTPAFQVSFAWPGHRDRRRPFCRWRVLSLDVDAGPEANVNNGTGNALDNVLEGNSGNNILDGKAGNDTYVVSTVIEQSNFPVKAPTRCVPKSTGLLQPMSSGWSFLARPISPATATRSTTRLSAMTARTSCVAGPATTR